MCEGQTFSVDLSDGHLLYMNCMNETQNKYAAVDCEFEWNKMRDILNMQEKNYKRKSKKGNKIQTTHESLFL